MKVYLFRFNTNYEEAGIIITTSKGLEFAKKEALRLGAWDTEDIVDIDCKTEGFCESVNYTINPTEK